MEAVELTVEARLLITATMDIPFELQYLGYISEFSEALFPSHLQASYHVNSVPDSSRVHCSEVLKATWPGKSSDKCAADI